MKFTFDFRKTHKLISQWGTPGNKLTKLTNPQTQKLISQWGTPGNKLTKLTNPQTQKLISQWGTPGNKLTKLTNPLSRSGVHLETNSQNSQTHCKYPQEQLPPKQKLTFFSGHLRPGIGRISNNIRYSLFSSEFVSLQCLTMCEEKMGREKIVQEWPTVNSQNSQTHKLISPEGSP